MSDGIGVAALVVAGLLAWSVSAPSDETNGSGDVILSTSFSRSPVRGERAYVRCGPPGGEPAYKVQVSFDFGHSDVEGQPCPAGPREPMATETHPELAQQLREAMDTPMTFEGGDATTCGAWGTDDPQVARELLSQCGPLTRGEL